MHNDSILLYTTQCCRENYISPEGQDKEEVGQIETIKFEPDQVNS